MEFINATKLSAAYTLGLDPDGRERLVVVAKGTFSIPENGEEPVLLDEQEPLVMADVSTGEPGKSAVVYESEFAPFKPRCDVLLNGSAYSPYEDSVTGVEVGLQVGEWVKQFHVFGERRWTRNLMLLQTSGPEPFDKTPISYDLAYSGSEPHPKKEGMSKASLLNPVGVGYYPYSNDKELEGKLLANTSKHGSPVTDRKAKNERPWAFGVVLRNSSGRLKWGGTYDDEWLDKKFPFLPDDFDTRYFQSAPEE